MWSPPIVAASLGAVFEWYGPLIYAMFVPTLSKLFFPPLTRLSACCSASVPRQSLAGRTEWGG